MSEKQSIETRLAVLEQDSKDAVSAGSLPDLIMDTITERIDDIAAQVAKKLKPEA